MAKLAEFGLREVFDNSVEEEHEVLSHPKRGRRRNDEDVVGCVGHDEVAEEAGNALAGR